MESSLCRYGLRSGNRLPSNDPQAEMPRPAVNVKLGHNVPDFLWWHLRLAVELDPYGTHSGAGSHRRDHRKGLNSETMGLQ